MCPTKIDPNVPLCDVCREVPSTQECWGPCGKPICKDCAPDGRCCSWCIDALTEDH